MTQARATAGSSTTQVIGGVTFFTSQAGKALALFPRIPRTQYNWVLALAKDETLKAKLEAKSPERVMAFRYDVQRMLADEIRVTCFEQVKAEKQRGAAFLYRKALRALIGLANAVLLAANVEVGEDALLGEPTTYDDLVAKDADAAFAELVPESVREY